MPSRPIPDDVRALRETLKTALDATDSRDRQVGNAKYGVYAFFDFNGEPLYVGQTVEQIRVRIGRHLTGRRSDPVAKSVLDPDEVAEIEMWPFFELERLAGDDSLIKETLNRAEHTVFQRVLAESTFDAVLNEGAIPETEPITLPSSIRMKIVPDDLFRRKSHPDVRIARRAATIADLARQMSERSVSTGLRRVLVMQARRLEHLAEERLGDFETGPEP